MDWLTEAGDRYQLLQQEPAVIVVEFAPGDPLALGTSGDDLPEVSFSAVVDVAVVEHRPEMNPQFRGALAEIVVTDTHAADPDRTTRAATSVQEHWGFELDFVSVFPQLEEAVVYAVTALDDAPYATESRMVMVVGPAGTADRTRAALGLD